MVSEMSWIEKKTRKLQEAFNDISSIPFIVFKQKKQENVIYFKIPPSRKGN